MSSETAAALRRVTAALNAAEDRPAQEEMAEAVAQAIESRRHLVVQAGTGTGKSLAYLVPNLVLGTKVVISTATKALQDQLADRDLPFLAKTMGLPLEFAVLKGRSNYLCAQRISEIRGMPAGGEQAAEQLAMDDAAIASSGPLGREIKRLLEWANQADVGDRAALEWEPSPAAWAQVSVAPGDCPGKAKCPSGEVCFAEKARRRAAQADVIVVNTHLYATHLAAGGEVLPAHDVVVFDEAHELEDIASSSLGMELTPGRLHALARVARPLLDDPEPAAQVDDAAAVMSDVITPWLGKKLPHPLPEEVADRLGLIRTRVSEVASALGKAPKGTEGGDQGARLNRAKLSASNLQVDLDLLIHLTASSVAWGEGPAHNPVLKVAPIDVGEVLEKLLWSGTEAPTGILTSATIPPGLPNRVGLPDHQVTELDVGSPYDYPHQALLYCALHMPDPRSPGYGEALADELVELIQAARGRTMALFTSWRAMEAAAKAVAKRVEYPVIAQGELPKSVLVERFSSEHETCLFATMGFWQGVDVPGSSLSVVAIDRLPFPRPDDPLLQARRDRLGKAAFEVIDVPRAATLLAQGAGRLIRSGTDRGVVAVLDPRLGKARYRWQLINALPPMRRTRHRSEVIEFLREIAPG